MQSHALHQLLPAAQHTECTRHSDGHDSLDGSLLSSVPLPPPCEQVMIAKLKAECGSQFTSKLEGMFKDVELSGEPPGRASRAVGSQVCVPWWRTDNTFTAAACWHAAGHRRLPKPKPLPMPLNPLQAGPRFAVKAWPQPPPLPLPTPAPSPSLKPYTLTLA